MRLWVVCTDSVSLNCFETLDGFALLIVRNT